MDTRQFADALRPVLDGRSAGAASTLVQLQAAAEQAGGGIDGIAIDVFVDQDGEGPFDVWARFEGDAAFGLDRRFDDDRRLFGVEWGEEGWEPEVPGRPRGWTRDDLERAVLDAVAEWLAPLLPLGSREGFWRVGAPGGLTA